VWIAWFAAGEHVPDVPVVDAETTAFVKQKV
jgi:hypothetical protein